MPPKAPLPDFTTKSLLELNALAQQGGVRAEQMRGATFPPTTDSDDRKDDVEKLARFVAERKMVELASGITKEVEPLTKLRFWLRSVLDPRLDTLGPLHRLQGQIATAQETLTREKVLSWLTDEHGFELRVNEFGHPEDFVKIFEEAFDAHTERFRAQLTEIADAAGTPPPFLKGKLKGTFSSLAKREPAAHSDLTRIWIPGRIDIPSLENAANVTCERIVESSKLAYIKAVTGAAEREIEARRVALETRVANGDAPFVMQEGGELDFLGFRLGHPTREEFAALEAILEYRASKNIKDKSPLRRPIQELTAEGKIDGDLARALIPVVATSDTRAALNQLAESTFTPAR